MAIPKKRPRRVEVVPIQVYGSEAKVLLSLKAVLSLISENLCSELDQEAEKGPVGLSGADGKQAR